MRILLFLFTLLVSISPLLAQPRGIPSIKIESVVRQNLLAAQKKAQETHKAAPTAEEIAFQRLANLQNPVNWKHISWQEFLKQNEHTKGVERVSTSLDIKCTEEFCALLPGTLPMHEFITQENSEPDYKTLLTGKKLIFVAEGNNHDTKRAPQEMAKILQATREANPHAKILFAAEFLNWTSYYNVLGMRDINKDLSHQKNQYLNYFSEFQCATTTDPEIKKNCDNILEFIEDLNQEIKNPTPLLKQARQASRLYTGDEYEPVFQTADALEIDQLALDDILFGTNTNNKVGVKVGEYVIEITPQDNVPFVIGKRKKNLSPKERLYNLDQVVSVSPWGVRERNREWARRIEALMPLYDIVIVYAGNGHLDTTYFMDLQPMLKQESFVNILLYPLENLPKEKEKYYTQRFQATERGKVTQRERIWEDENNINIIFENILDDSNYIRPPWEDPNKPYWVLMDNKKFFTPKEQWDPEKTKLFNAELDKQKELFPYSNADYVLTVYLPAN